MTLKEEKEHIKKCVKIAQSLASESDSRIKKYIWKAFKAA